MSALTVKRVGLGAAGLMTAGALWWRKNPSACPYGQRFWLQPPHPLITRARLHDVLSPQPGERVLEVGPGTGYYSLHVAEWITPGGRLDIFDLQQEMLDHTMRRAGEAGLTNLVATQGDGEIPDQDAALRELGRVLKPGGRLVVGELFGDPHWVSPGRLRQRAECGGLSFAGRRGTALGYFARYER